MPLPPSFHFLGPSALQTEAERRAILVFGEQWREVCTQGEYNPHRTSIFVDEDRMTFNDRRIWNLGRDGLQDLSDGSPAKLAFHDDGSIESKAHFIADELNDPTDGSPAQVDYYKDGLIKRSYHYSDGKINDPDTGRPAFVESYANGNCMTSRHYRDGLINDPGELRPAQLEYYHDNGELKRATYYRDGIVAAPAVGHPSMIEYYTNGAPGRIAHLCGEQFEDLADGSPARVDYSETGEVAGGFSSKAGELTVAQTTAQMKAAQRWRAADLLSKADQAVVPSGMPLPDNCAPSATATKSKDGR